MLNARMRREAGREHSPCPQQSNTQRLAANIELFGNLGQRKLAEVEEHHRRAVLGGQLCKGVLQSRSKLGLFECIDGPGRTIARVRTSDGFV